MNGSVLGDFDFSRLGTRSMRDSCQDAPKLHSPVGWWESNQGLPQCENLTRTFSHLCFCFSWLIISINIAITYQRLAVMIWPWPTHLPFTNLLAVLASLCWSECLFRKGVHPRTTVSNAKMSTTCDWRVEPSTTFGRQCHPHIGWISPDLQYWRQPGGWCLNKWT